MNPVTVHFLASISRRPPDALPVGDLMELARMYQRGDLIHIDSLPASKAPPATAESLYVYRDGL